MGFKLKPSSFKQTTRTETRTTTKNTGQKKYVFTGKAGKPTTANKKRWYFEYLKSLEGIGSIEGWHDSELSKNHTSWDTALNNIKLYMGKLDPSLQYELHDYNKKTHYPRGYKEWKAANPGTETIITEQRDITNTPGSPGYESKGGYDEVWGNMSLEEQQKYANKDEWIIEAEKWKKEQAAIAAKEEIGEWRETDRVTRRTT